MDRFELDIQAEYGNIIEVHMDIDTSVTSEIVTPHHNWPDGWFDDQTPEFPVSLLVDAYYSKPDNEWFIDICRRIGHHPTLISIRDLAESITKPCSFNWCAGIYDLSRTGGRKCNESWTFQQLFAIDIDGKPGQETLGWKDLLCRCDEHGIRPSIIYTTHSALREERYRVVFALPMEVHDERIRDTINRLILGLFPEADQSTTDAARIVTGGKDLLFLDEEARLDIECLVNGFHIFWMERDRPNYARKVKEVAKECKLNILPSNVLDIRFEDTQDDENRVSPATEGLELVALMNSCWDYRYLMCQHNFIRPSNIIFAFRVRSHFNPSRPTPANSDWRQTPRLHNPNFKRLAKTCPVFRSFVHDERRFSNPELFAIASNLNLLNGGIALFKKTIAKSKFQYDQTRIKAMASYVQKRYGRPVLYLSAFPSVVSPFPSMYHASLPEYGEIVVTDQTPPKSLDEAHQEFKAAFEEVLRASEPGIYVLKSPPGFGKTEFLLGLSGVAIALPRHDLIGETAARFRAKGVSPVVLPEYPAGIVPPEYDDEIRALWSCGCYRQALERLRVIAATGLSPAITEYVDRRDAIKNVVADDLLLTTHASALGAGVPHHTLIFDEDVVESILDIKTIRLVDVLKVEVALMETNRQSLDDIRLRDTIVECLRWCRDVVQGKKEEEAEVSLTPVDLSVGWLRYRIEQIVAAARPTSNVITAMESRFGVRTQTDYEPALATITVRSLPLDRKIIVMTGTADKWLYRQLFGSQVRLFFDVGQVEARGRVVCYHDRSFSRTAMKEMPGLPLFLDSEFGSDMPRISFKAFAKDLDASMTFGATTGMNGLAGRDVIVVGTPHKNPIVYRLIAGALGHHPDDPQMVNQQVERGGLRFWFFTFRDEVLRNIHLHLVEAELVQAVGRARHLRHDVVVTAFGSFPLPGSEYDRIEPEQYRRISGQ